MCDTRAVPKLVVHGAQLKCSQGSSPSSLSLATRKTSGSDIVAATIDDFVPVQNIAAFGSCLTQANPQVAAATSAAQGVLTPQPCIPVTTAPWSPGATKTTIDGRPALVTGSTCNCTWSGTIEISDPASAIEVDDPALSASLAADGFTHFATFPDLELRELDLSPDLVVVYHGINETQPAAYLDGKDTVGTPGGIGTTDGSENSSTAP